MMNRYSSKLPLGVHVLTEFIFCPLAGMQAYEGRGDDSGELADAPARLDYLPDYDAAQIEEELDEVRNRLYKAALGIIAVWGAIYLASFFDTATAVLIGLGSLTGLPWVKRQCVGYLVLHQRLRLAQRAVGSEPDPNLGAVQQVNWWELVKAGWEPFAPPEPIFDASLGISGRPWRILRRGALAVPVFRKRFGDRKIHFQHAVRIAAYAHLLETCERAKVPYGVIMYGDGYDGESVPLTPSAVRGVEEGLAAARQLIAEFEGTPFPPPPPKNQSVCRGCPLGRPRLWRPGRSTTMLGKVKLATFLTYGRNHKSYHSDCGDRYRWVPPHAKAIDLGLQE